MINNSNTTIKYDSTIAMKWENESKINQINVCVTFSEPPLNDEYIHSEINDFLYSLARHAEFSAEWNPRERRLNDDRD